MRTTIIIKDDVINKAAELTGIKEKTALVHAGLEALIEKKARERLAALQGTAPKFKAGRRRR
jgi:Arc/MetJ family transcription regulator